MFWFTFLPTSDVLIVSYHTLFQPPFVTSLSCLFSLPVCWKWSLCVGKETTGFQKSPGSLSLITTWRISHHLEKQLLALCRFLHTRPTNLSGSAFQSKQKGNKWQDIIPSSNPNEKVCFLLVDIMNVSAAAASGGIRGYYTWMGEIP